jgi:inorganic triphosphatase YgiF
VKAETGARGIAFDRSEWETEVEDTLDLKAAENTPLGPFLDDEMFRATIGPAFTVITRRHGFLITMKDATVELVLDRTTLKAGLHAHRFAEIELELRSGEPAALFRIARKLSTSVPLRLSATTKSERGYRLLDGAAPKPVKSAPVRIVPGTTCAEAFQIVAREALSQIVRNEDLLRSFGETETLHQMRVGFRRLKAALAFFKPLLTGKQSRRIQKDLRRAAKRLGPARDLDVLQESLAEPASALPARSDLDKIAKQRAKAYEKLNRDLETRRFKKALLRTAIWVEAGRWLSDASVSAATARDRPVEVLAAEVLARRWKRLRRDAKRIEGLPVDERHALRMRIKTLRYGSEFFAETFEGDGVKRHRKALLALLEAMQEILGDMNDLAVRNAALPAAGIEAGLMNERMQALTRKAARTARRLRAARSFWD